MTQRVPILFLLAFLGACPLHAATYVVDTSADTFNESDGVTSLREALIAANSNPGKDFVVMSEFLNQGITLVIGSLIVSDEVDIDGSYSPPLEPIKETKGFPAFTFPIEVSGDNKFGVMAIFDGPGTVVIRDMVLSNGLNQTDNGGGIDIRDPRPVTLQNVTVRNCRTSHNGGGIHASGAELTLLNSTVDGNECVAAGGGGGLHIESGMADLVNSKVVGNRALGGTGGGIGTAGPAILSVTGGEILSNRAFSGGGIGAVDILKMDLSGATIADNTSEGSGGGCLLLRGDLQAVGTTFTRNVALASDPLDGGGGLFNAGVATIQDCTFDSNISRGFFFFPGTGGGGGILNTRFLTLTDSIVARNQTPNFGGGAGILTTRPALTIIENVRIVANHSAAFGGGLWTDGTTQITGGEISGNSSQDIGGGVINRHILEATGTRITKNVCANTGVFTSQSAGGGISSVGSLTLRDVEISSNGAPRLGGGLDVVGEAVMIGGIVTDNSAESGGGVRVSETSVFYATETVFSSNVASSTDPLFGRGGALLSEGGTVGLSGVTISDNTAETTGGSSGGGGIFSQGILSMTETVVTRNLSLGASHGGGIYNSGRLTVLASTLSENTTQGNGGGIESVSGEVKVLNSTLSGNRAETGSGGGVSSEQGAVIELIHATLADNHAGASGGGFQNSGGTVRLGNTILAGNTAEVSSPDFLGGLTSMDFNLIGDTSNGSLLGPISNSHLNTEARLGPLADNGGSFLTHNLLGGSPAIDAGDLTMTDGEGLTTDQRGFNRVRDIPSIPNADGGVDMGAVEVIGLSVSDGAANEGDGVMNFNVSLSHAPPEGVVVTVLVSTSDAQESAVAEDDYEAISGALLIFSSNSPTVLSIPITLNDDSDFESDETFELRLSNAAGATVVDTTAVGIILNDDAMPTATASPMNTPSPSQTPSPSKTPEEPQVTTTRNYDVRPIPPDGVIDAFDLIEWHARIGDGSPESEALFDFARLWNPM